MKRIDKTLILQQDQSDCGVACLASIIKFHQGESSLENLRKLSGTSKQGTTLLGLMQTAQQVGFEAEGLEAEGVQNLRELKEPAILHVTLENKLQHYLVYFPPLTKNVRQSLFFFGEGDQRPDEVITLGDPAKGIIEMSAEELNKIWQSKALLKLMLTEKFEKKTETRSKKKEWIIGLIKEDLNVLLISLFLGIAISILGICTAIFSQKLIDDILPKENTQKLLLSLVLVTLLLVIRSGLTYLRGLFMISQAMDFNNRIIQRFYSNLLQLPKSFFDTRKTGELIARMNDTHRIQSVLSAVSGGIVIDFLVVLVSLGFLFAYSSIVGFIMLGSLPVYFLILLWFNKPIIRTQKEVMSSYAMAEGNFVDIMQGVADIKSMNKQGFFEKINATVFGTFQQKMVDLGHLNIKFSWVSEVTGVVFMISVFGLSSWLVLSKELKLGEMVALLSMAGSVIPSANRLVVANIQIQEALVAFGRMFEFTSIQPEYSEQNNLQEIDEIKSIKVDHVSFRFTGRKQLLKDISFKVSKGETIALLGESGIGKSTLIQLLQKFYQPENGNIIINHNDLQTICTPAWREKIGVVPQEVKIFNGTLLYNIVLSNSQDDVQQAILFCNSSGLSKFFEAMPQGYLTIVGEEGINLSGGQKQLVALARVLWRKPKLLLLDEATSGLDRNTEKIIMALIKENKSNVATIIVTHKIKTASNADRIYIIEDGVISVSGTPVELLKTVNFYSVSLSEDSLQ